MQDHQRSLLGYLAAITAGSLSFIVSLLAASFVPQTAAIKIDFTIVLAAVTKLAAGTFVISISLSILPFLLYSWIAASLKIRSIIYFVAGGAVIGSVVIVSFLEVITRSLVLPRLWWLISFAIYGAIGGLVYWLVAVRQTQRKRNKVTEPH